MELTTSIIKNEQVQNEVNTILDLLREKKIPEVTVSFGFGCGVDIDDLYAEIPVKTDELKVFLERSVEEDKYTFGSDDLYIKAKEIEAEFLLCHESDVHLYTEDVEVLETIKNNWLKKNYEVYQKEGQEWQRIAR